MEPFLLQDIQEDKFGYRIEAEPKQYILARGKWTLDKKTNKMVEEWDNWLYFLKLESLLTAYLQMRIRTSHRPMILAIEKAIKEMEDILSKLKMQLTITL